MLPPVWFLWLAATGGLGVEPIKALEHKLGELALQILIATLAVRPLREWTGVNLLKHRRALGVVTFAYVFLHLLVWLLLDVQILSEIWADIIKRPYITVGMVAFVLMLPMFVIGLVYNVTQSAIPKLFEEAMPLTLAGDIGFDTGCPKAVKRNAVCERAGHQIDIGLFQRRP